MAPATNVTYQDIRTFSEKLRQWYFFEGGMFLSRSTQSDGYAPLQNEIGAILRDATAGAISEAHYDKIRGACSQLPVQKKETRRRR